MALITEKFFERDSAREQERYEAARKAGFSDCEARTEAQEYADPPGLHIPLPECCFRCGEKLTIPFVFWSSGDGIGLHIECAAHLSVALYRDVMEHRCGRDRAQYWYVQAKPKAIRVGEQ